MITPRLSVGNGEDAREVPPTFSALLLVAEEFDVRPPSWIEYAKIPLTEYAAANVNAVARAVDWIEQRIETNRILVCCRAGMGRSVSMVLAYLCCVEGMTYVEADRLVRARRPGACPLPEIDRVIQSVQDLRSARAPRPRP